MYFPSKGADNTEATVRLVCETARERNIRHLVVASNFGDTARHFLDMAKERHIVCVTLACGGAVPEEIHRAGIRARSLRPAEAGMENAFACRVVRVVEDVNALTVLLRPEATAADAPPIRMEADRGTWRAQSGETVTVAVDPGEILLLSDK